MLGLTNAKLIRWSKGFNASGVEGENVVELLQQALIQAECPVKVAALVNDTVGTLVSRLFTDSNCNYFPLSLSLSLSLTVYIVDETMCPRQMIVNMEWAFFGDRMDVLPVNQFDKLVDEHSATPGERTLEKLTSGMYLGELAR